MNPTDILLSIAIVGIYTQIYIYLKKSYIIPLTIIFAFAGSFVFRHNPADLYFLLFFGIFGYILKKLLAFIDFLVFLEVV